MKDPTLEPLDEQLRKLTLDVSPDKDLWPTIVRDLGVDSVSTAGRTNPQCAGRFSGKPRRVGWRPWAGRRFAGPRFATAAAVTSACVASAATWAMLHNRPMAPTAVPAAGNIRSVSFEDPRDKPYVAARADLEKTFHERLGLLDPGTRNKIESSLAVIRQAHDDIRKALADAPDNAVLEQLLASTLRDEFDLYDEVVRTTQPTLSRT